jgi:hypothetical protein
MFFFPSGFSIKIVYSFVKLEALDNISQHAIFYCESTPNKEYRPLLAVPVAYSVYCDVYTHC